MVGHTAAGKTTLAKYLSEKLSVPYISEGEIKRSLKSKYSSENSLDEDLRDKGYKIAIAHCIELLAENDIVIIDASFHKFIRRNWLFDALSSQPGTNVIWLHCNCPNELKVKERLDKRAAAEEKNADNQADQFYVYEYIKSNFDAVSLTGFNPLIGSAIINIDTFGNFIIGFEKNAHCRNILLDQLIQSILPNYLHLQQLLQEANMTKLFVFRHAESVYGNKIYAGNMDIPLSSSGVRQATNLSIFARETKPDIVFTSRLIRTMETALIMLADNPKPIVRIPTSELINTLERQKFLPLIEIDEINERNYGELQNVIKKQVLELYSAEEIQNWRRGFYAAPPGGESFCDVVKRVQIFIDSYIFPYIEKYNILVVAHQNTMRAIYYLLMDQSPEEIEKIEFENCEGIQFDFQFGKVKKALLLNFSV